MKFLFDENIGWLVVNFFRNQGYDVKSILDDLKGSKDKDILKIAYQERRIIVTLDKDFCDLIFRDSVSCQGIILLRLSNESQKNIVYVLRNVLENIGDELKENFVAASERNVRIRRIR